MRQGFFFFFFLACFFMSNASPIEEPKYYKILKSDFDLDPSGPFQYAYETENGIKHQQQGDLKTIKNEEGKDEAIIVMRGSYQYIDLDGNPIQVNYYADETGFHAEGAHIPVPNAVPVAPAPVPQQRRPQQPPRRF